MDETTRTLVCVPIMCEDIEQSMRDAVLASELGADLVEFRVDSLVGDATDEHATREVCALIERSPVPVVLTCRPTSEGGEHEGEDAARLAILGAVCASEHAPAYIDVEIETIERCPAESGVLISSLGETRLLVSTHDFDGRPVDLLKTVLSMREIDAARVVKVAFRARSARDNLELFDLLAERDRPTVALAMGEAGLMSRVLAPKFGGFLTFASVRDSSATAPGQPTVRELLDLYRFRSIGEQTKVFGVVGWPVGHSKSPALHNAAFGEYGVDGVYVPIPVPPEWEHFKATVSALVDSGRLDLGGLSVTIPHKAHAVRLAEELGWAIDETASRAGAANTVTVRDGAVTVSNTDGVAARACLEGVAGSLGGNRIAILGAGGVARGIVSALVESGSEIVVFNRTPARAHELAHAVQPFVSSGTTCVSQTFDSFEDSAFDIVINCTPIGMEGGPDEKGLPMSEAGAERLGAGTICMDTVYTPVDTPFLRRARANGSQTIDGRAMFLRQAMLQFEGWTGIKPSFGAFEGFLGATTDG